MSKANGFKAQRPLHTVSGPARNEHGLVSVGSVSSGRGVTKAFLVSDLAIEIRLSDTNHSVVSELCLAPAHSVANGDNAGGPGSVACHQFRRNSLGTCCCNGLYNCLGSKLQK